jgi:predicted ABC-type ATPase
MQPSEKQKPYLLSAEESNDTYYLISRRYLGNILSNSQRPPMAIFLAGQPGSGKTILRNHLLDTLQLQSASVVINTDDLREYHPAYKELTAKKSGFADASYLVNPDSVIWANRLREDAIKKKTNILFDVTLGGDPAIYSNTMAELKKEGYELFLAVLAVKQEMSRLGIHLRYESQLAEKGAGRFVGMEVHDRNYSNLTKNIEFITNQVDIEKVTVYARYNYQYKSHLENKAVIPIFDFNKEISTDKLPVQDLIKAIANERTRDRTRTEKEYLNLRIQTVNELIKARGGNPDAFLNDIKRITDRIDFKG